ncbi:MAG: LPS export ABC transporter ATP-binding protein [Candidatus Aminicenantes bacterium]|nr:LPS export ABC transporter ATP-binding protein [Candidatus Aminicenantes bacterium]
MSLLQAKELTKIYHGRPVVNRVNLEFRSGEIVALLGRNGAGKTTTFQMIVGLIKPDYGEILFNGQNITKWPTPEKALAGIIYLPQENSIFLRTTVENNLNLILELQPLSRKERKATLDNLLARFNLYELRKQGAHTLSGGEQRKLEIARALILDPQFLLLDEPFTGIDPLTILDLQRIILNLKNEGRGIIISDHNVQDTFQICDRVYIIDEGQVLVSGSPEEVAQNELARQKFLGLDFSFNP